MGSNLKSLEGVYEGGTSVSTNIVCRFVALRLTGVTCKVKLS